MSWLDDLDNDAEDIEAEKVETKTVNKEIVSHEEHKVEKPSPLKYWNGDKTPCMVGFSCSMTITTGPYENVRPSVLIKIPADFDKVEEAYNYCTEFVDKHLTEMRDKILEELENGAD